MDLLKSVKNVTKYGKQNSPALLVITGLIGMGASMFMVNSASKKADKIIKNLDIQRDANNVELNPRKENIENVIAVAPLYLPAALTFAASSACIIGSYKISAGRIASLATAYSVTEHKLEEYQNKVLDMYGTERQDEIEKEIMKDHIRANEKDILEPGDNPDYTGPVAPDGKQWFWDDFSKRFFRCTQKELFDAREAINVRLQMYPIKLNEFYCELGIGEIEAFDIYEWAEGDELDIRFEPYTCSDGVTVCMGIYYDVPIARDYSMRY